METILPGKLNKNDAIGFFSPSSPATVFAVERFERAKKFITERGFRLIAGRQTGKKDYYRSGTIEERALELNELIQNPEVRCIMSTIGGLNSNSLLPYIDYESLANDPKIIIGYSDVTAILLGIYAKTGLVTFYGPSLVASFGEFPPLVDETFLTFNELLCNSCSGKYQFKLPACWTDEKMDWANQTETKKVIANNCQFRGSGSVSGRLVGGNLNTVTTIWGSPYMPEIKDNDILFIEDSLKNMGTIERLFSFLKVNGVFDKVSAIILGKHELFDDQGTNRQPIDVLNEVLGDHYIHIVNGFDCCHTHPMLTLPIGIEVAIDFDNEQVSLQEPWLKSNSDFV